jgi:hypothetical protein
MFERFSQGKVFIDSFSLIIFMRTRSILAAAAVFSLLEIMCAPKFTPPDLRECVSITNHGQPVITYNANAASTKKITTLNGTQTQYFDLVHEKSLSVIGLNDPALYTCYYVR